MTGPNHDPAGIDPPVLRAWSERRQVAWLVHVGSTAGFRDAHLPGAVHLPEVGRLAALLTAAPGTTVVYGSSPGDLRPGRWVHRLRRAGHHDSWWLQGGVAAWRRDGGSVETSGPTRAGP